MLWSVLKSIVRCATSLPVTVSSTSIALVEKYGKGSSLKSKWDPARFEYIYIDMLELYKYISSEPSEHIVEQIGENKILLFA